MAEREREEIFGAIKDVYTLFNGAVDLSSAQDVRLSGRDARKFRVTLGKASVEPDALEVPPPAFAKRGVDENTKLRLDFYQRREPKSLTGEIWIDAETAVLLKAKLEGRIQVPEAKGASLLRLSVASEVTDIGKAPRLKVPADFLPDEDKPLGIADALERFGYSTRKAADGGTAEEPEDEPSTTE